MSENGSETETHDEQIKRLKQKIKTLEKVASAKEIKKSKVRIWVTYTATAFLFVGGPLLMLYAFRCDKTDEAISIFQSILPISAAIISFWFAGRNIGTGGQQRNNED